MRFDPEPTPERFAEIVRDFAGRAVVVLGDLVADQFLYGEIARVSREAPVFILRHEATETTPGGAANCAVNLAALGARVFLIGALGADEAGRALLAKLRNAGIDCAGVVSSPGIGTTTKVRILAGQAHSTRQQVIRVDYEHAPASQTSLREKLLDNLRASLGGADACIISDYNYGVADERAVAVIREARERRTFPVNVDSRFRLTEYPDFTSATPNEDEVEGLLGRRFGARADLEAAARELRARLGCQALLITRGPEGMLLQEAESARHIAAVGAREPVDVTGAGDTVIAAYTLALAAGADFAEAAHLANRAGGLVVMKRGTASISRPELLSSLGQK